MAGIDGEDQHLVAEPASDLPNHLRPPDRPGVDRHLVGTGAQQDVHVGNRADTAAHRQGNEHRLGGSTHHVQRRLPALG
jgi:hypothetical protein